MKKYLLILLTPLIVFAQTYMAKVEPYEEFIIYSQSSGKIVKLDKNDETKVVTKTLVQIDDSLEKRQLAIFEQQLKLYDKKLNILENSYNKYIKIRGKSQSDKDDKLYEVIDLKISIESLKASIAQTKDSINKKTVNIKNLYIKEFNVNNGDYVSIGKEVATAYDISKSKLVVYVSADDYKNIINKKILIDEKDGIATIEKINKTIDDIYVSAYKVTLILEDKNFGKVMKVEFIK
jgi:multidrug resistance efflux pump